MHKWIAGFELTERLCESAKSVVYRARSEQGTSVVLKALTPQHPSAGDRFDKVFPILDRVFTTKALGQSLGMTAIAGITRAHQGAILVESQENVGTRLAIFLPLSLGAGKHSDLPPARPPGQSPLSVATRKTALLIDDEEMVRKVTGSMLKRLGYRVVEASCGRQARSMLNDNDVGAIDCVLIDYSMPAETGLTCLAAIRQIWPAMPAVVMSGLAQEVFVKKEQQIDYVYLQKPFRIPELSVALEAMWTSQKD